MYRHAIVALSVLLVAYLGIALFSVATRGQNEQLQSQNFLNQAAQEVVNSPVASSHDFKLAGEQATLGLMHISLLPWWSKILTPLPPFRYRIETLQADIQLASAGNQACQLRISFPPLLDPKATSTSDALSGALNTSMTWYQRHTPEIITLQKTIKQAEYFMPTPPPQLVRVNQNLSTAITALNHLQAALTLDLPQTVISLRDEKNQSLGHVEAQNHRFSTVLFQDSSSAGAISITIPQQLILALVSQWQPLELSGVSPKAITGQSLQSGQASYDDALSALAANILSHPEHFKDIQTEAQKHPSKIEMN